MNSSSVGRALSIQCKSTRMTIPHGSYEKKCSFQAQICQISFREVIHSVTSNAKRGAWTAPRAALRKAPKNRAPAETKETISRIKRGTEQ
jgi:hypothetical protein